MGQVVRCDTFRHLPNPNIYSGEREDSGKPSNLKAHFSVITPPQKKTVVPKRPCLPYLRTPPPQKDWVQNPQDAREIIH